MNQRTAMEFASQTTRAIFDGIVAYGADPEKLLSEANLTIDQLEIDTQDKHLALWQAGETLLNCTDIGLQVGSRSNPLERGIVGVAFASSKHLRMALDSAISYIKILVDYIHFEITDNGEHIYIKYSFSKGHFHRYGLEHMSAAFVNWTRVLLEQHISPVRLSYQFAKPAHSDAYSALFSCPVSFDQPENIIVLSTNLFKLQKNNYSEYLRKVVTNQADQLLEELNVGDNFIDQVSGILSNRLYNGNFSAEDIAASLNMSKRTYFRKLTKLEQSHQGLLDKVRKKTAISYLNQPESILKNVPCMLGYSDFRSFSRAFKRWTGYAPKHYVSTIQKE